MTEIQNNGGDIPDEAAGVEDTTPPVSYKLPPRRIPIFFAVLFYGFLTIAGLVWIYFAGTKSITDYFAFNMIGVALGVGFAVLVVGLSSAIANFKWAQHLEEEFGWMLGEQRLWELPILAIISGLGEEVFFRGAMQHHLGLYLTSAVFGIIHFPINRKFIAWPIFAAAMGLLMGWEYEYTGTLIAPILTHALINLFNLWRIVVKYRDIDPASL